MAVYQQQSFPSPCPLVIVAQGMDDVIQFSSCSHSGPPILPSTCPSPAYRFELDDDPETERVTTTTTTLKPIPFISSIPTGGLFERDIYFSGCLEYQGNGTYSWLLQLSCGRYCAAILLRF